MDDQPSETLTITWEPEARDEWRNILSYFIERNGSYEYSMKLDVMIQNSLKLLCEHPEMGQRTLKDDARRHIVENYTVFYRVTNITLEVVSIRDARREAED